MVGVDHANGNRVARADRGRRHLLLPALRAAQRRVGYVSEGALGYSVRRDGKPVILRLRYPGGGLVTLAADPGYFRNRAWRTTDVPPFMVPLLTPDTRGRGRGRVTWDEYHQGFGRGGSLEDAVLDWLARTPAGWALLQLVAVGLVALAVAAVRFGPARSVIDRRRRSPLEHVEALAVSLEGAGGVDTAVGLMVAGLRRRLGRAFPGDPSSLRSTDRTSGAR